MQGNSSLVHTRISSDHHHGQQDALKASTQIYESESLDGERFANPWSPTLRRHVDCDENTLCTREFYTTVDYNSETIRDGTGTERIPENFETGMDILSRIELCVFI